MIPRLILDVSDVAMAFGGSIMFVQYGQSRQLRYALGGILVIGGLCFAAIAERADAQILDPLAPQAAYTTADPNNTDRIGLATLNGRYAVTPVKDCDWLAPDQSVLIYPDAQMPPWLAITGMDGSLPGCTVRIEGRMSNTPCFQTDGVCDWSAENDP